jgi:hypothetical protein
MARPLLIIMNPRRIPECISALEALPISKLWIERYTEHQIAGLLPALIDECDYDPIGIISDDSLPTADALSLVLKHYVDGEVVTAYCNVDERSSIVNLSVEPLVVQDMATLDCYTMPTREDVEAQSDAKVRTWFAGHTLTFMSRELWRKYPFVAIGGGNGSQSDYSMSCRLQTDGVPIWAVRGAFVQHLKALVDHVEQDGVRRLLIGVESPGIRWDHCA